MRSIFIGGLISVILAGGAFFLLYPRRLEILSAIPGRALGMRLGESPAPTAAPLPKSPLTGAPCETPERRPLAVMLAGDPVARPLSGLAEADMVVEMPVTMNQVTRLMALYQCARPKELGSIRSSRHDFLPIAAGFDAIYAHWGGSHFALEKLAANVLDNVDALINPHDAFFRKRGITGPHNGFTSYERLWQTAGKMGYRATLVPSLRGSPKGDRGNPDEIATPLDKLGARNDAGAAVLDSAQTIRIDYNPNGYAVRWEHDAEKNAYKRFRAGAAETDKNTGEQVEAVVIILMQTTQKYLEDQYTEVRVIGAGPATIYQRGNEVPARWEKKDFNAPLRFVDGNGNDVSLAAGKRWIEIVTK